MLLLIEIELVKISISLIKFSAFPVENVKLVKTVLYPQARLIN